MLKRLKIDSATFNSILKKFYAFVDYEDSIGKYFTNGYKNKKRIKAEKDSYVFICQADIINYVTGKESHFWLQKIITADFQQFLAQS